MAGIGSGGEENFAHTVLQPVDLTRFSDVLTADERLCLQAKHGRFARVWGFTPARKGPSASATELAEGDQAWFHHRGYIRAVADVVTVLRNVAFDKALWDGSGHPASGFVFTLTAPRTVELSKAWVNTLLGYKPRYTWQGNRLLSDEQSTLLANSTAHLRE